MGLSFGYIFTALRRIFPLYATLRSFTPLYATLHPIPSRIGISGLFWVLYGPFPWQCLHAIIIKWRNLASILCVLVILKRI